jgi:hypothetical protein
MKPINNMNGKPEVADYKMTSQRYVKPAVAPVYEKRGLFMVLCPKIRAVVLSHTAYR